MAMTFQQELEEALKRQQPIFRPTYEGLLSAPQAEIKTPETFQPGLLNEPSVTKTLGLLGLSFAPGAGISDYSGTYPSAQGGFEPSFQQNLQQGNYLTAGFQGLGAFGDMATATGAALGPLGLAAGMGVGSIAKAPRAVQRGVEGLIDTVRPKIDDLGFFSQVEKSVMDIPQQKGTGQQFLAQIQKTPGVKPEEIQYTGLDTFLANKPTVTKGEIQDYLDVNRVQVQEVVLAGNQNPYGFESMADFDMAISRAERAGDFDEADRLTRAAEAFEGLGTAGETKFSQYTLPGGENYREVLLTLPESGDVYRSSHFDQPNILAHMRVNDRTIDGKPTLFIEEVQSDWHQAGRKKGYATGKYEKAQKSFNEWMQQNPLADPAVWREQNPDLVGLTPETNAVPDAPFKTSWDELTLKRAIKMASDEGYDQIAFTTGKTQAERYSLSKSVNAIEVTGIRNNIRSVKISSPDNKDFRLKVNQDGVVQSAINAQDFVGRRLDEIIGKDMASEIMQANSGKSFTGLDLDVGGEGMKGFYDKMLPKKLEKLGKKYGAKPTKSTMQTPDGEVEVWTFNIPKEMRETVKEQGQPLFQIGVGAAGLGAGGLLATEEEQY